MRNPKPIHFDGLLQADEVVTSTELVTRLSEQHQISAAAARKRLERVAASSLLWRSEKLLLPKNNRLFAHAAYRNSAEFFTKVAKALSETRPGLARCLQSLGQNLVIHELEARKLLAAPLVSSLAFPGLEEDIAALEELGVQVYRNGSHRFIGWKRIAPNGFLGDDIVLSVIDRLRRESLLARVLTSRLRKQNLLSWNGTSLPSYERLSSDFNEQPFTAYGFSYLRPLVRQKEGGKALTPCPVLIDIYSGACGLESVQSFVHRAERAVLRRGKQHAYLGVIAARSFPEAAWNFARSRGLMAINLVQMFGDDALDAMVIVEHLLGGFELERATDEFRALLVAIDKLKSNPVVVDLYSIGFEAFTGLALRDSGYEDVAFNTIVPFNETTRDVDVSGRRQNELVVIECKAYAAKKELAVEDVKKFFTETLAGFVRWWSVRNGNRQPDRVRAEIWTTGKVGRDAGAKLAELKLKSNVAPKLCDQQTLEKELSFEIKTRMGQFLSAIARGGESDPNG